jgi:hypothetical protein
VRYGKALTLNILLLTAAAALVGGVSFYFSRKNAAGPVPVPAAAPAARTGETPAVEPDASASGAAAETPDKTGDPFAAAAAWFKAHPRGFGLFVMLFGVFMLAGAIFNWDWIFRGHSFNLQKIEGIANFFGRGFARVWWGLGAAGCIITGILVMILA